MKLLALPLLLAASGLQAQPAARPSAPQPAPLDAQSAAAKLKGWKGSVARADGRLVCRTRTSTGDRRLDAIRCGAMLTCARPLQGEIDRLAATAIPAGERRLAFDRLMATARPCMDRYQDEAIARLLTEEGGRS
ncbi:hypothetical protein [Pelagerythrobacter marinus]|uniref:hypothetical protein n=1 Tax=Pelagerythrobacter marinus TaxID=538382 RepID=UPI002036A090|nr:hypothetical protein [Pelagerythrobacter marinus]USA39204.1 hypothetical protein NCF86_13030 [Pelagerythrobacter marinus]WPZ06709.1 hypothetical protein T8T98_15075 [Pelagerythrobacter marinus]